MKRKNTTTGTFFGASPCAGALVGAGFASLLLLPVPAALAAQPQVEVLARDVYRVEDRTGLADPVRETSLNDPAGIAIRSRGIRPKAFVSFTVTDDTDNAGSSPSGSLRQVLNYVSSVCYFGDTNLIGFNIPGGGLRVIQPTTPLPPIDCSQMVVDAFGQPGATTNTVPQAANGTNSLLQIAIDGSLCTGLCDGITITAPGAVAVRALDIRNFSGAGIRILGTGAQLEGNFIGTNETATACMPNQGAGIAIDPGASGGSVFAGPASRNLIACNLGNGIQIDGSFGISDALIGVGSGLQPLGNVLNGVAITGQAFIGSTSVGGNVIAHNGANGIATFSNSSGNTFSANDTFLNGALGIDLGSDGITANNTNLFPSGGPNGGQNYPVVGGVTYTATTTTITGSMHCFSNSTCQLEVFENLPALGLDEGARFAGTGSVAVVSPPAPFSVTLPGVVRNPTMTARVSSGTSEFSPVFLTPVAGVNPSPMNFGTVAVGSSAGLPLTIGNSGDGPMPIASVISSSPAEFSVSNVDCPLGGSLSAGNMCAVNVTFVPQNSGARAATLTVNTGNTVPGGDPVINLAGTGDALDPTVTKSFSPNSVVVGTPSTLRVTIANPNTGAPLSNVAFTDVYPAGVTNPGTATLSSTCGGTVTTTGGTQLNFSGGTIPVSGSCDVTVDVTAAVTGSYVNTLGAGAVTGSVIGAPVSNSAAASATLVVTPTPAPALSISPAPVDFGNVTVNTTAGPQVFTLANTGTANLDFSPPFTVTGDYAQTTACPTTLVPSPGTPNSCTVDVSFTPTATGVRTGVLTITSNAPSSQDMVNLTGTGSAAPVPVVSLAPTSLTFVAQTVGTTSAAQPATLTNTGTATLNIGSIAASGDYAFTTTCAASVAPSGSCSFSVTFTPIVAGTRTGSITIPDDASGSPHVLSLTGTGTLPPVATITVSPSPVSFPPTQVGVVSAEQVVTISNTGGAALTISSVQVVGAEFTVSLNGCTAALSTGGSCPVKVVFAPAGTGTRIATLRIISNAATSPTQVTLTGTGTAVPSGTLDAQPAAVTFVDQVVGTSSASQSVAVSNTGVFPVTVASVSVSGDFTQTNDCTVVSPGGAGCMVTVVFSPQGLGTRNGALTIVSDASNPALSVSLLGNGVLTSFPVIELSATALGFGNRVMGVGSSAQVVTVRNTGGANLVITRIYLQGDFRQSNDCTAAVVPGATCRIDVGFVPSIPGTRGGKMFVESNATSAPKTVDLAGTGCRFFNLPGSRISSLICQ